MADKIFEPEISRSLKKFAREIQSSVPVAIECKKETGTSFKTSRVEEHQLEALLDFEKFPFVQKMIVGGGKNVKFRGKTGFDFMHCPSGKAYILINFRATRKASGRDIPKGTNRCFCLGVYEYAWAKGYHEIQLERSSIPYSWFVDSQDVLEIERCSWKENEKTVYGWDLSPLLDQTITR